MIAYFKIQAQIEMGVLFKYTVIAKFIKFNYVNFIIIELLLQELPSCYGIILLILVFYNVYLAIVQTNYILEPHYLLAIKTLILLLNSAQSLTLFRFNMVEQ